MDGSKHNLFLSLYHFSVYDVLADEALKYNAKIGTMMADRLMKSIPVDQASDPQQLKELLETNLRGKYKLSGSVSINFDADDAISVHITGCAIFEGNELLKSNGKQIYCPICHMFRAVIQRGLKTGISLAGIVKPGEPGECYLKYKKG